MTDTKTVVRLRLHALRERLDDLENAYLDADVSTWTTYDTVRMFGGFRAILDHVEHDSADLVAVRRGRGTAARLRWLARELEALDFEDVTGFANGPVGESA